MPAPTRNGLRAGWPKHPDDAPTADQIARAYVLAAGEVGDAAVLGAAAGASPDSYRKLCTRARWIALRALVTLWPRTPASRLAPLLGYAGPNAASAMISAERSPAWSQAALDRVIAGI